MAFLYEHGGGILFGAFMVIALIFALKPRSRRSLRNGGPPPVRYPQRVPGENDAVLPSNFRILEGAPLPLKPRLRNSPSMIKWASGFCPYEPKKSDIAGHEPTEDFGPDSGK